jgi:signal transduction histidine kinase
MKRTDSDTAENGGVQFFGKVTASISHEIRNVLAVIKENAGLLEDLTLLAEKGRPLEIERVRTVAGKVKDQVMRGDGIVQDMNRFAHSVDHKLERVDLSHVITLVIGLARRLAFIKGIKLESQDSREGIMITTNPFLLENLIWTCLELAMEAEPYPETVTFDQGFVEDRAQIRMTGFQSAARLKDEACIKRLEKDFMENLEGDLAVDPGSGEILIRLPRDIS